MASKPLAGYIPRVGEKVLAGPQKLRGTCRFVGITEFAQGEWIGIELDDAIGKNNGTVQGKSYFQCKDNHGIFMRQSTVLRCADAATARHRLTNDSMKKTGSLRRQATTESASLPEGAEQRGVDGGDVGDVRFGSASGPMLRQMNGSDLGPPALESPSAAESPALIGLELSSFEAARSLIGEVDAIRKIVAKLEAAVQDIERRASAVEHVGEDAVLRWAPGGSDHERLKAWLEGFSSRLQEQVWSTVEGQIEGAVARALAKAAGVAQRSSPSSARCACARGGAEGAFGEDQARMRLNEAHAGGETTPAPEVPASREDEVRAARSRSFIARHSDWTQMFEGISSDASAAERPGLGRSDFVLALQRAHPQVSRPQAEALWRGITRGMGKPAVERFEYCQVCEAVSAGDAESAEFAGMGVEAYRALGGASAAAEPDEAAAAAIAATGQMCAVISDSLQVDAMDAAALKIQARVRGSRTRTHQAQLAKTTVILQRWSRSWLERKHSSEEPPVIHRQSELTRNIFQRQVGSTGRTGLGEEEFRLALLEANPMMSPEQAAAVWAGYCQGMRATEVDAASFSKVAEACMSSKRVAAEFADMSVEAFSALGYA